MILRTTLLAAAVAGVAVWASGCGESNPSKAGSGMARGSLHAEDLTVEHLVRPTGVSRPLPRFSWVDAAGGRGVTQSAYQVIVGASAAEVHAGKGTLWDSGKVASAETRDIAYSGRALKGWERAFWAVRVWDATGSASGWSEPEPFAMGVLAAENWPAQWIGYDVAAEAAHSSGLSLAGASWLWAENETPGDALVGRHTFAINAALPAGSPITRADLIVTADDLFKLTVNGKAVGESQGQDAWRVAKVYDVTKIVHAGDNQISLAVENVKQGHAGVIAALQVTTADGKTTRINTDSAWTCDGKPVRVLGAWGINPWGKVNVHGLILPPPVLLRREVVVSKPVAHATLSYTALGIADAYLNGQRISDDRFNPGWTDYPTRAYYRAYDVTAQLKQGSNALGAELADGWYSGYLAFERTRERYGKKTRFAATLSVTYKDGTSETFSTDGAWRAATGPTLEADFLMGEAYDARKEMPGWARPGFDDSRWAPVTTGSDEMHPKVEWHPGQAVKDFETFTARETKEVSPGVYVLDLGQNFAGTAKLKLTDTKPGQKIVLRFAERLQPDGTMYVTNLRNARAIDTYICKGAAEETWQPRHTFHGFQYVEISGLTKPPAKDTVTGVAIASDTPMAGSFECSDPMLNRLYKNIYYTQRANFIDVPTDCPQRDERLGWTADAQFYARTATLNTDTQAFFDKWLIDLIDSQRADGQFPKVAPEVGGLDDGGPAWADAGTIVPWEMWEVYGDRTQLERQYPSMAKFVDYCEKRSTKDLLPPERFHSFGDWLSIRADTPHDVIYVAHFARSAELTARAAEVLGKTADAQRYFDLARRVKASFNKAYVSADGRIKGDTQTCYIMAITFGLVEGDKLEAAKKYLVADIEKRGTLSTGFIGTKDLMTTLQQIGRTDVAFKLLHSDVFPSWGFEIKNGATSIWERWDGWTPEKGFQDPGMNSFAHYSFGAVYRFMVEAIGGIQADPSPAGVGFAKLRLAPEFDPKLTWAKVTYNSPRGKIASSWKRDGATLTWTVTVPANVTATILLPTADAGSITESGKSLSTAPSVTNLGTQNGKTSFDVASGTYTFTVK